MGNGENDRKLSIATLASALILSRGYKTAIEANFAVVDAGHLLYPAPADEAYKEWQRQNGMRPSTAEADEAEAQRVASENRGRRSASHKHR